MIPDQLFEARLKAVDLAQDFLKQLVTLASAALVLSVGFFWETFEASTNPPAFLFLLPAAWSSLVISAFAGAIGIGVLVNNLDLPDRGVTERRDFEGVSRAYAAGSVRVVVACWVSMMTFVLGMVLFGVFATVQAFF